MVPHVKDTKDEVDSRPFQMTEFKMESRIPLESETFSMTIPEVEPTPKATIIKKPKVAEMDLRTAAIPTQMQVTLGEDEEITYNVDDHVRIPLEPFDLQTPEITILHPLEDATVVKGETAVFDVEIDFEGVVDVKWYNEEGSEIVQDEHHVVIQEENWYILEIDNVQPSDEGLYKCVVDTGQGEPTVTSASLKIQGRYSHLFI